MAEIETAAATVDKYMDLFIVDVEATSTTPMTGVMTEFAAVHVVTEASFYGHLYRNHPNPDTPALPVAELDTTENPIGEPYWIVDGKDRVDAVSVKRTGDVAVAFRTWLDGFGLNRRTLVSDNNGFDAMWLNCFINKEVGEIPFGHSSRRIGDFYAGVRGKWSDQSSWKRLRRTRHTHHPLDDARGNVEALRTLLGLDSTP
jgi:hypothetical protein